MGSRQAGKSVHPGAVAAPRARALLGSGAATWPAQGHFSPRSGMSPQGPQVKDVLEERGGVPKRCVPKMAQQDFPNSKFVCSYDGHFGLGGGGGVPPRLSAVLLHPLPQDDPPVSNPLSGWFLHMYPWLFCGRRRALETNGCAGQ